MQLRPVEQRDLERVRELRNSNRAWFFDGAEITPEQQELWFDSLAQRSVHFYVLEEDGVVVGTVSVTDTPSGREIGNLTLDDAYRGRGLMTRAVEELTREPAEYFARVKEGNPASFAVFDRVGFTRDHVVLRLDRQPT